MKPILKYAGGKAWVVDYLAPGINAYLVNTRGTYIEPFLGGGAMAFGLAPLVQRYLSDASEPLVHFYQMLVASPGRVYDELSALVTVYGVEPIGYYSVRERFNAGGFASHQRAAAFLYMNKLGYNGLWRVNSAGVMNVPVGDYKVDPAKPMARFPGFSELVTASALLFSSTIDCIPFEPVVERAQAGDVLFADPPYEGGFDDYTAGGFPEPLHVLLAEQCTDAAARGVVVFCTVSELSRHRYERGPFTIMDTLETRAINSKAAGRKAVRCLLVVSRGHEHLVGAVEPVAVAGAAR